MARSEKKGWSIYTAIRYGRLESCCASIQPNIFLPTVPHRSSPQTSPPPHHKSTGKPANKKRTHTNKQTRSSYLVPHKDSERFRWVRRQPLLTCRNLLAPLNGRWSWSAPMALMTVLEYDKIRGGGTHGGRRVSLPRFLLILCKYFIYKPIIKRASVFLLPQTHILYKCFPVFYYFDDKGFPIFFLGPRLRERLDDINANV